MFSYPAACDLEEELLELVAMVIVAGDGEQNCKLRPYDRVRCALVYLRKRDTLAQLAAGFTIGTVTAWRYVNHAIKQLAHFAPTLTEILTSHHADGYVLLDGTVAEPDRVAAPGHFSGKVRREGVNLQVITAEEGRLLWISPALPAASMTSRSLVSTTSSTSASNWTWRSSRARDTRAPSSHPSSTCPHTELPNKHKKSNKVHAALRAPVERTISPIKQWRTFRHARISPNRLTSAAATILTLTIYT